MDSIDSLEINQENLQKDFESENLEDTTENLQHLSDILVTQIILCITIVTGIFILNIFKPEISKYIIDTFKHHSNIEFSESIKYILSWLYDRI